MTAIVAVAAVIRHLTSRNAPEVPPLKAAARGLHVGVSVRSDLLDDGGYTRAVARIYDTVTPENELKWEVVHPRPHRYDFGPADRVVGFARNHGLRVRGHTLVWHEQLPGWLAAGRFDRRRLLAALRDHIETVVGRYRGRIAEWDVVNEAVADDGTLRRSIWEDTIGPDYIAAAFRYAHQADPGARLVYNDYGGEGRGPKADGIYRLVKALKDQGAPIDAVGFQTHVDTARIPGFAANLRRFAALGLDVELTEVDVRLPRVHRPRALLAQAAAYRRIVQACLAVDRCREIGFWGFDDRDSWVPAAYPGEGDATLFDGTLHPKPAYEAVREVLLRG